MKKLIALLMALAMVFSLAACGGSATDAPAADAPAADAPAADAPAADAPAADAPAADALAEDAATDWGEVGSYTDLELTDAEKEAAKGLTIGVTYCLSSAPAVKVFAQGVQEMAAELGINIIELDGQFDATIQADHMNTFIGQEVDGILLNPADGTSLVASAKAAYEAEIPVVTGAMTLAESGWGYLETFVGPDDVDVGRIAGKTMVEHLGETGGQVVIIEGTAGSTAQVNRTGGFEESVAGTTVEVVAKISADYDEATAMSVAEDMLTKYPDLKGIFCHDDTMAAGAAQAMKELGYTSEDIVLIGYSGSAAGAKLIEEGVMVASAIQPLVDEGRGCIKALVKAICGEELNYWYKDVISPLDAEVLKTYDPSLLW